MTTSYLTPGTIPECPPPAPADADLASLFALMVPTDPFEEVWLKDFVTLRDRINTLRAIVEAVHSYHLYRLSRGNAPEGASFADGADELRSVHELVKSDPGVSAAVLDVIDACFKRLVGMVYTDHLDLIAGLERLIIALIAERDRIVNAFSLHRKNKALCDLESDTLAELVEQGFA